jgi:hypothetical protein
MNDEIGTVNADLQQPQKLDQQLKTGVEKQYQDFLKQEQDRISAQQQAAGAVKFDEFRQLGFATKNDIEQQVNAYYGRFVEKLEQMEKDNAELRQFVLRAKMQGFNSGQTDDTHIERNEILEKFKRPFNAGMK